MHHFILIFFISFISTLNLKIQKQQIIKYKYKTKLKPGGNLIRFSERPEHLDNT